MRLARLTLLMTVALCALTVHVPSAWADNTTCANAAYIFPGEVASDTLPAHLGGSTGQVYFNTAVVAGRSYSIAAWAPFSDPSEVPSGGPLLGLRLRTGACASPPGLITHGNSEPDVDILAHHGDRIAIIPNFTGTLSIRVSNGMPTPYPANIRVVETTLFSPWWFVGGTNQAFAEIRNNTNASFPFTATFFASDGTVCGSMSGTLPANGNTVISVGVLGTCAAAVSGSAQIAFRGAPGALVANITTIDGVQATSFDSPFTPRMKWGAFKR